MSQSAMMSTPVSPFDFNSLMSTTKEVTWINSKENEGFEHHSGRGSGAPPVKGAREGSLFRQWNHSECQNLLEEFSG